MEQTRAGLSDLTFGRILIAFDGSENALKACAWGATLARSFGSEVRLLYVMPPISIFTGPLADEYYAIQEERAKSLVQGGLDPFTKAGVKVEVEILRAHWSVVETIINCADDRRCTIILMGARGAGGFEKMLLGSVSSGVVSTARCPVLIVR